MTRFKTSAQDNSVRLLDDTALETVTGGVKDGGCIPGRPTLPTFPTSGWVFKDIFARPTLGTYH